MFVDVSPEILVFKSLISARPVLESVQCSLVRNVSMFDFCSGHFLMDVGSVLAYVLQEEEACFLFDGLARGGDKILNLF